MKKYLVALSTTVLIGVAPFASASSTDLTVTGLITPAACLPAVTGGGIVDHGKIESKDLKQTSNTSLPDQTLHFSVNCESATVFTLKPVDNRPDSSSESDFFGLGKIDGNQKLGGFDGVFQNALADGAAVRTLASSDNGGSWYFNSYLRPLRIYAFGSPSAETPIAIKDLTSNLVVRTYIARADSLDLTNEVPLDGSTTLEIHY
ncbi:DUF1120 domain-containing protein [Pseudomonas sp. LB3P31]